MNIFYEYEGIIGKAEVVHLNRVMDEFMGLSKVIRRKLGRQAYLLDKYITLVMEAANATLIYEASEDGFNASSELRGLIRAAMDSSDEFKDHLFFGEVKKYVDTHPLAFQERRTRHDFYHVALFGDFMAYAVFQYMEKQRDVQRAVFDIVYLRDLYRQIVAVIEDEPAMEQLNLLLRQRFLPVSPMAAFLQGMTNDLLYSLCSRDTETNQRIMCL